MAKRKARGTRSAVASSGGGNEEDEEEDEEDEEDDYAAFNKDYFERAFEHEKMVGDANRMEFYHGIINDAVAQHKAQANGRAAPIVLDVGTGTGVLAAWAEKAGARQVYAFDHSERTLEWAATLAEANGCHNIAFMCGHSSQFDLGERTIDIIVHEQLGDVLFDEHVVRTITDLRDRVLRQPGGRIVPSRLRLMVEPVKLADDRHVPMMRDVTTGHGLDFACLQPLVRPQDEDPDYHHFRSSDPSLVEYFLAGSDCDGGVGNERNDKGTGSGTPAWAIDLQTCAPDATGPHKKLRFSRKVTRAGRLDALCIYFEAHGGGGGDGTGESENGSASSKMITTGPMPHRAAHWGYRLLRCPKDACEVGDVLDIEMWVTSDSCWEDLNAWRWKVTRKQASQKPKTKRRRKR